MIVTSQALALAPVPEVPTNVPVFGWHNLVTIDNVSADTEDEFYPALHVANPSTNLFWRGADTSEQHLTVTAGELIETDYIGVGRHNLGSAAIPVALEVQTEVDGEWIVLVDPFIPQDDGILIFRYVPQVIVSRRLAFQSGNAPPEVGVLYAGKLLVMDRGLPVGIPVTPFPLGREADVSTARSEAGDFQGRTVLAERITSEMDFRHLDADWYRESCAPFVKAATTRPFFFAWWPERYPRDTGYCWELESIHPVFDLRYGTFHLRISLGGISE